MILAVHWNASLGQSQSLVTPPAATVRVILQQHTTWTGVTPFRFLTAHSRLHTRMPPSHWLRPVVCCGLDQSLRTCPSPIWYTQAFKMERLLQLLHHTRPHAFMSRLARLWSNMPGIPDSVPLSQNDESTPQSPTCRVFTPRLWPIFVKTLLSIPSTRWNYRVTAPFCERLHRALLCTHSRMDHTCHIWTTGFNTELYGHHYPIWNSIFGRFCN